MWSILRPGFQRGWGGGSQWSGVRWREKWGDATSARRTAVLLLHVDSLQYKGRNCWCVAAASRTIGQWRGSVGSGTSWAQSRPSPPHLCPNANLSALVRDASLRGLVTSMMQPPHDRTPSPHVRARQKQQLVREYQLASQPVRRKSSCSTSSHSGYALAVQRKDNNWGPLAITAGPPSLFRAGRGVE